MCPILGCDRSYSHPSSMRKHMKTHGALSKGVPFPERVQDLDYTGFGPLRDARINIGQSRDSDSDSIGSNLLNELQTSQLSNSSGNSDSGHDSSSSPDHSMNYPGYHTPGYPNLSYPANPAFSGFPIPFSTENGQFTHNPPVAPFPGQFDVMAAMSHLGNASFGGNPEIGQNMQPNYWGNFMDPINPNITQLVAQIQNQIQNHDQPNQTNHENFAF